MPIPHDPTQNHLLDALPGAERARVFPLLEWSALALGETLAEPGEPMRHVFFPTTAIVSLQYAMENGSSAEVAVVGNEGMVGVSLFMGGETTTSRAVVRHAGYAYRMKAGMLKEAFTRAGALQQLLLRYTQALLTQMAQTSVCNRHHSVDQQLCRWLLLSLDRLPTSEVAVTQEQIAGMLGVRREGVTEAAGKLQRAGLIAYSRGHITVLDRAGLEARVCECYAVVKREVDRLLPAVSHATPGVRPGLAGALAQAAQRNGVYTALAAQDGAKRFGKPATTQRAVVAAGGRPQLRVLEPRLP